jgi:hypothetical protein
MKENGSMSTPPLRRRKDQEMLSPTVGTLATVPRATGDDSNAVEDLVIQPIHEDIARRAYQLYEDDWFQAERELRQFLDDAVGKFLATEGLYVGA